MTMDAWTRASAALLLAALGVGCGGTAPRPIEVTEAWTSGDERAVGIDEVDAAAAEDDAGQGASEGAGEGASEGASEAGAGEGASAH